MGFESTEEFANALRLPVIGYAVSETDGGGSSSFNPDGLTAEDRDYISSRLYAFYRIVSFPEVSETDDPRAIVRERITEIRTALTDLEKQLEQPAAARYGTH